jgi:sugar transferase (PEP-CTERM system associated)
LDRQKKTVLFLVDILMAVVCFCLVALVREEASMAKVLNATGLYFITLSVVALLYIFGSYDINHTTSARKLIGRLIVSLVVSFGWVVLVNYFVGLDRTGIFGRSMLGGSLLLFSAWGMISRSIIVRNFHRAIKRSKWLIVASSRIYELLQEDLKKNPFQGQLFYLVEKAPVGEWVLGGWDKLDGLLKEKWNGIVVAIEESTPNPVIEKLMMARLDSNRVRDLVQFYEELWQKVPLYYLGTRWFLLTEGFSLLGNPVRLRIKRLMDVAISVAMLVLSTPILLLTAICIRLESPGPIIYRQVRTGRDGKDFIIFKFRSMRVDAEAKGPQWAQEKDTRITFVGGFIRKMRIDELPQLINVLGGSMSFVGPRPERPEFNLGLEKQLSFYSLRHLIQPGLTGWAQVLYPYGASVEDAREKLQYDLFYIKNHSVWLDISIVLKTIQVVLFGKGR